MEIIKKYFPGLPEAVFDKLAALYPLYSEWNDRINVISRKDMDFFIERHVLHSLAIAHFVDLPPGGLVLDAGTGGGFPGIPLAIVFPDTRFVLVDSIGKKIKVVQDVANRLGLKNVEAIQQRVELLPMTFDFVVSRAVKPLPEFMQWVDGKIAPGSKLGLPNGVLYLKGGDVYEELNELPHKCRIFDLSDCFSEDYFQTKKLIHLYK